MTDDWDRYRPPCDPEGPGYWFAVGYTAGAFGTFALCVFLRWIGVL